MFHIKRMITCRVSLFDEDISDTSISRASFFEDDNCYVSEKPRGINHQCSIKRKPLPKSLSIPGEYPPERPVTTLLPMPQRSTSRGWGEEWTHLVQDTGPKGKRILNLDSASPLS